MPGMTELGLSADHAYSIAAKYYQAGLRPKESSPA